MMFPREEVETTVDRYHELRRRIDEGQEPDAFGALADFYTDDAVYIDGAWGRLEGRDTIARWLVDSMLGMEDWKFPIEFTAIEGDDVVVKWTQIMPRTRPDGSPYRQSGEAVGAAREWKVQGGWAQLGRLQRPGGGVHRRGVRQFLLPRPDHAHLDKSSSRDQHPSFKRPYGLVVCRDRVVQAFSDIRHVVAQHRESLVELGTEQLHLSGILGQGVLLPPIGHCTEQGDE